MLCFTVVDEKKNSGRCVRADHGQESGPQARGDSR